MRNTTKDAAASDLIKILSADSLEGRKPGTIGMEKATKFVEDFYKTVNLSPLFFNGYRDTFKISNTTCYNVVGVRYAKNPTTEYILMGAHLDHLGVIHSRIGSNNDSIFNGANDDASGVAVLLNMATLIKENNTNKNIIFAVFSGEEDGLIGSRHLSNKLKKQKIDLKLVINLEMLGVPLKSTPKKVYLTGFSRSNFAEISNHSIGEKFVVYNEVDDIHNLFYAADNYPFSSAFNIPSHTVSTYDFENDPYYHDVNDEYENIDLKHLNKMAIKMTKLINKLEVDKIKIKN